MGYRLRGGEVSILAATKTAAAVINQNCSRSPRRKMTEATNKEASAVWCTLVLVAGVVQPKKFISSIQFDELCLCEYTHTHTHIDI